MAPSRGSGQDRRGEQDHHVGGDELHDAPGELPPGIAMVSFEVGKLPAAAVRSLGPSHGSSVLPYAGRHSATYVGAAGEFIELIEQIGPA